MTTELASCCRKDIPGQCFAGYEKFDLLHGGRKLAGAAQRRNKLGLLIQGSIQPVPSQIPRARFLAALIETGDEWLVGESAGYVADAAVLNSARRLNEERYAREDYHRRR
jgi:lipoate-protein ligase A